MRSAMQQNNYYVAFREILQIRHKKRTEINYPRRMAIKKSLALLIFAELFMSMQQFS